MNKAPRDTLKGTLSRKIDFHEVQADLKSKLFCFYHFGSLLKSNTRDQIVTLRVVSYLALKDQCGSCV